MALGGLILINMPLYFGGAGFSHGPTLYAVKNIKI